MFDEAHDERAENMREVNTLRDIDMQQRKADVYHPLCGMSQGYDYIPSGLIASH